MNTTTLSLQHGLLSPMEAAQHLGVSRRTIYRKIHTDELPFFRLGDSPNAPLRVDPDDLTEWLRTLKKSTSIEQPTEQLCR